MSTAKELNVGDDLVEGTETETETETKEPEAEKVDVKKLVVFSFRQLLMAQSAKAEAEAALAEAEKEEQVALERLYQLTDEGDLQLELATGTYRVRKRRGRATGYEFVQVSSNTIDLSKLAG